MPILRIPITLLLATQPGAALRAGMTAYLVLLGGAAISAIRHCEHPRAVPGRSTSEEQTFLESMGEVRVRS